MAPHLPAILWQQARSAGVASRSGMNAALDGAAIVISSTAVTVMERNDIVIAGQ
jgi:hypothetical protein